MNEISIHSGPHRRTTTGSSLHGTQTRHYRIGPIAVLAIAGLAFTADLRGHPQDTSSNEPAEHEIGDSRGSRDRLVLGEVKHVRPGRVVAWALLTRSGKIEEVGVTVSHVVFTHPPESGDGPLGAIASVEFPKIVREGTYFNHCEVHWNPHGHPSPPTEPDRYAVQHFDLHFYSVPEAVVWGIPALPPPLPDVPAERLPINWTQPGGSEPEMGRHSVPTSIADGPFVADVLAGFLPSGSTMHFIEPMITQEFLAQRQDFEMPVPRPAVFGRLMLYPEKFAAEYDAELQAWHFVFRQFAIVE
jgi:hypothetical protein